MSQSPASSSMPTSSNFTIVFEKALKAYQKTTKQDLTVHPLTGQLQACDSPTAILTILQGQVDQFTQSRSGHEKLKSWLNPTINVLYAFSATLGEGVGLVFSPAKVIFAGAGVLLLAAKDVEASQGVLIEVFERIENFFRRLEVYSDVPPSPAMTDMMVKIIVEVLDILGTATKEMKQSRAKKILKRVAGITKLEDGLKRLDKMTNEEVRMASAEALKVSHNIVKEIKVVEEKVQMAIDDGKETAMEAKMTMQQTAHHLDDVKRRQLRECLRKWQSPPDPSTNHELACECQHEGTAKWFCQGSIFEEWKVAGSLLWIHGKPGSGKSILCSAIIQDITTLCDVGSASVAYFYFDFRNIDKRSRRTLLASLLVQLSACSDAFCDVLSRLYEAHDDGARQPSDSALLRCLKEMLTLPDRAPVYLILDALDECSNTSGVPSSREQVLGLLKEVVGLRLPRLHICVTSRPEIDIKDALDNLVSHSISLHDESGQKKDIAEYVRSVVHLNSVRPLRRWRDADRDLVIETLSEKADGMFRWVFCQLETLRHCLPQSIPHILNKLPVSLDETYERVLKEIGTANQQYAYRLLQCLTVAIRPLRVEELAEILALDFDGAKEGIPELKEDWRWNDQQEAILSTCSSLVTVVGDGSNCVVQFSHVSVKEFLTSDRLAAPHTDISHFHIRPDPAHTVIAKACLGILLRLDNGVGIADAKSNSPLAKYAAKHWVDHTLFEKASTHLQVGMRPLFNPALPYFEAWVELYDIDEGWDEFMAYGRRRGSPLYYASLCGFRDLATHLIAKHPHHLNATLGRCLSPLVAALYKRHFDIAELLYQHGADVGIRGYKNRILLHAASAGGFADIVQWLLDHCVDAHSQQDNHKTPLLLVGANGRLRRCKDIDAVDTSNHTPLHLASLYGRSETVRLLIEYGAEVTSQDRRHRTPLHLALSSGSPETVRLLIEHGADVNARDESHKTPLHLALASESPETVQVLIEHGADVNARDGSSKTPLYLALASWSPETVQLLIEHGADVNAMYGSQTPLHLALSSRSPENVRLLVQHGVDINARDESHKTPLHLALASRSPETVQVLIEHGANVNARDGSSKTPLYLALASRIPEAVRLLIEHGADVNAMYGGQTPLHLISSWRSPENVGLLVRHGADINARNGSHKTPLHLALASWSSKTVQVLIEHGADVNAMYGSQMPLHLALSWSSPENVRLLVRHGADINARDESHKTPLHLALASESPEIVQVLIEHGADVNARYKMQTPLHLALSSNSPENVRLLAEHGADINARDEGHKMPLHLALASGSSKTVQILIEHGADVNATYGGQTPLHLALSSRSPENVRLLVRHGADINARGENHNLKTPLHLALASGSPETVQVLIEHGADVNARYKRQMPLHLALSSNNPENVRLLAEHGADVNIRDWSHKTPLHLALCSRSPEIVQVLIEHGADVNARDGSQTPLHLASSSRCPEIVRLLIEHGAEVTSQGQQHQTPLHQASSGGDTETVRVLIEHGADVNARDEDHKTPLHLASSRDENVLMYGYEGADVVQVLIQHGADVTARDNTCSTPLHLASSKGSGKTVMLLLGHGADVNAQDGSDSTPLHLALSDSSYFAIAGTDVVHPLLNHGANVDAVDDRGQTPFQIASEITKLLLDYQV